MGGWKEDFHSAMQSNSPWLTCFFIFSFLFVYLFSYCKESQKAWNLGKAGQTYCNQALLLQEPNNISLISSPLRCACLGSQLSLGPSSSQQKQWDQNNFLPALWSVVHKRLSSWKPLFSSGICILCADSKRNAMKFYIKWLITKTLYL